MLVPFSLYPFERRLSLNLKLCIEAPSYPAVPLQKKLGSRRNFYPAPERGERETERKGGQAEPSVRVHARRRRREKHAVTVTLAAAAAAAAARANGTW